jgi:hypothetical protein
MFRNIGGVLTVRFALVLSRKPQCAGRTPRAQPPGEHALHNFPPIKGGCYSIRASRFLTDDRCHLPPRAGRTPRPFRALAISARVSALAFRIAWITGIRFVANSSATCAWAMRPIEPATQRFVGLPSFAPLAFFACSAALVRSDISRRSFSARAAYRCSMKDLHRDRVRQQ